MGRLCEKGYLYGGVVGEWREMTEDRGKWSTVVEAGRKLVTIGPHPLEREEEKKKKKKKKY